MGSTTKDKCTAVTTSVAVWDKAFQEVQKSADDVAIHLAVVIRKYEEDSKAGKSSLAIKTAIKPHVNKMLESLTQVEKMGAAMELHASAAARAVAALQSFIETKDASTNNPAKKKSLPGAVKILKEAEEKVGNMDDTAKFWIRNARMYRQDVIVKNQWMWQ